MLFVVKKNLCGLEPVLQRGLYVHMSFKLRSFGRRGVIVEIDEAKFGKRKYNRGRIVTDAWVFGGIERGTGNSFMVSVPD